MTDTNRPPDWPGPDDLEPPSVATVRAPYTAVTGFMTVDDVKAVAADSYTISGFGTPIYGGRRLAVGVLASWKTLCGEPVTGPFANRYPAIGGIRAIIDAAAEPYHHRSPWQPEGEGTTFDLKARCLRTIHYNSKEPNLLAQIDRLREIAGPNLDGFQLNMVWPREDEIASLANDYPQLRFILQINSTMYSSVSRSPQLLATEIAKKYAHAVTDVLFDMSGGTGQAVDLAEATAALEALYEALGGADAGGIGIGLAGGLDWQNVARLQPLFKRWPDLSIDAEGRLRDVFYDPKDPKKVVADVLGEKAREYVRRAAGVMPNRAPETQTTP